MRAWVDRIKLAPESWEVEINRKLREPLVNSLGAGRARLLLRKCTGILAGQPAQAGTAAIEQAAQRVGRHSG